VPDALEQPAQRISHRRVIIDHMYTLFIVHPVDLRTRVSEREKSSPDHCWFAQ
jgi:hypothetical protein